MSTILYDVADRVCTITMNRPEVLNALNIDLIQDLDEGVQRAAMDPNIKVVILTGAGRGFCSGGDVRGAATPSDGGAMRAERSATSAWVRLRAPLMMPRKGWDVSICCCPICRRV